MGTAYSKITGPARGGFAIVTAADLKAALNQTAAMSRQI
jgi:hypothetical protein